MNSPEKSHAYDLLAFAHGLSLNEVPDDVKSRAAMCLLDALGCGLFGSTQEWSRILGDEMAEIPLALRLDTQIEVDYVKHGGIMPYVLESIINDTPAHAA